MFEKLSEWIWRLHGMNCREATRLASRSLEEKPSLRDRFQLACHLVLCSYCRNYFKQLKMMRRWLRGRSAEKVASEEKLSPEARNRLRRALAEKRD